MKTITNITYRSFALFAFACFALSPDVRAVCQEGCGTNLNTFLGESALISDTSGSFNTALGYGALASNTTGHDNTACGGALPSNTTGDSNTAIGSNAMFRNTTGSGNTATGAGALFSNSTGSQNTAIGSGSLSSNTTGTKNTAIGVETMTFNLVGLENTAIGYRALVSNHDDHNTACGAYALHDVSSGSYNVALGNTAGLNLTSGDYNIDIGNRGVAVESNTIRIGSTGNQANTFIAGIAGVTIAGGVGVIIDSNGHLGTIVSSERFKASIQPMDDASDAIFSLKPVTFRYKHELDPKGIPQFGLVAEDVEKVNPDLVARDEQGKPYTVRYEAVNAMLLNEFLKEHRKNEQQRKDFEAAIAQQQKQIEALTAGLQKVTAQLELNQAAPQTVLNNR